MFGTKSLRSCVIYMELELGILVAGGVQEHDVEFFSLEASGGDVDGDSPRPLLWALVKNPGPGEGGLYR